MITKPQWPDSEHAFTVHLYKDGLQEPCPACDVIGVRVIEMWEAKPFSFSRQTMMPCHCVVVSSKGLGGCGPRKDIPYPFDDVEDMT